MNSFLLLIKDFFGTILFLFNLFLSHRSDSGIFLRIMITNNAGEKLKQINASLHPMIGANNPPTTAAAIIDALKTYKASKLKDVVQDLLK